MQERHYTFRVIFVSLLPWHSRRRHTVRIIHFIIIDTSPRIPLILQNLLERFLLLLFLQLCNLRLPSFGLVTHYHWTFLIAQLCLCFLHEFELFFESDEDGSIGIRETALCL